MLIKSWASCVYMIKAYKDNTFHCHQGNVRTRGMLGLRTEHFWPCDVYACLTGLDLPLNPPSLASCSVPHSLHSNLLSSTLVATWLIPFLQQNKSHPSLCHKSYSQIYMDRPTCRLTLQAHMVTYLPKKTVAPCSMHCTQPLTALVGPRSGLHRYLERSYYI